MEGPAPLGRGHQGAYATQEIVNAILYQGRTGCQWAYLPPDLPPKSATYYYFATWRDDGTDQVIHHQDSGGAGGGRYACLRRRRWHRGWPTPWGRRTS